MRIRRQGEGDLERFDRLLSELVALLDEVGEARWSGYLRTTRRHARAGDAYAITHLLAAYGGMGSFSDLLLSPLNGHRVDDDRTADVNERLARLRTELWQVAHDLRSSMR